MRGAGLTPLPAYIALPEADLNFAALRRYEGEFSAGFANGLGSFTGVSGEVYRGEWLYGKRHG